MVSILPPKISPWQSIGKAMSELGRNTPELLERRYQRGQMQNSLDEIKELANQPGVKPLDLLLSVVKAGAGIPGSEKYIGQLAPEIAKFAQAGASQNVPVAGEQQRNREPLQGIQGNQQLPNFLNQPDQAAQFFPTNTGPQGVPGNIPRAATTGEIRPIPNRSEQISQARDLSKKSTDAGIPLTVPQALEQVKNQIEEDKAHNELVEKERQQRVASQKEYGDRAVEYLKDVYPKANPEIQSIFQKIGEQAASRGDSEADINRYLAKESDKFKNAIVNVQKDLSAPRMHNAITRGLGGTYKNFDKSAADARRNIQPLIDLGLFDTARNLLADQNYGPEEREIIINPLSSRSQSIINKILPVTKAGPLMPSGRNLDPNEIKSTLMELKSIEPNFSLLLARKAMEDKGIDWRAYKDTLNDLEQQGFELTDDQKKQRGYLDTPPLNRLEKILQGINLIGR